MRGTKLVLASDAPWGVAVVMVRMPACLALVGGLLLTGAVAGCSGSDSSGSRTSKSGAAAAATPEARPTTDPRKAMPVITPGTVGQIGYGPASATDRAHFARALKASGGLAVSKAVSTLTVSGRDVGGVAVYSTKKSLAKSPVFQDQYVVQLINAVTRSKSAPRFVRADGQVMALSTGGTAVAGWFDGNRVVLVYRQTKTPDLADLAFGVKSTPLSG
jgi:hypothetical protein